MQSIATKSAGVNPRLSEGDLLANAPFTKSKRSVHDLEKYAERHGIPAGVLSKFGWATVERRGRPAIVFKTTSGDRYRFTDGEKPKYDQDAGYQACWYGLKRAADKAKGFIVDCNGAASTIAADCAGIPAFSLQSGEGTAPRPELLEEIKATGIKRILVAFDCDDTGRRAGTKRAQAYRAAGFEVELLDLDLPIEGGDLADFVMAHPENPLQCLTNCKRLPIPAEEVRKPRKTPFERPQDVDDYEMIAAALAVLSSERFITTDYWFRIGMAIKSQIGDAGFNLWDTYSSQAPNYAGKAITARWRSFKDEGNGKKVTIGTLYKYADEDFGGPTWRPKVEGRTWVKNQADQVTSEPSAADIDDKSHPWSNGLPLHVRAAMNAYAPSACGATFGLIAEGILNSGKSADFDTPFNIEWLTCVAEALGRDTNVATIRKGIKLGGAVFLYKTDDLYINQENRESDSGSNSSAESCKKYLGRPAEYFRLLPVDQIIANLTRLAIPELFERYFPAAESLVAPMRAEFFEALGVDPDEAMAYQRKLEEKYAGLIEAQPGYGAAMKRVTVAITQFQKWLRDYGTAPIPAGVKYENASAHLVACAVALLEKHGKSAQLSRAELCDQIGCKLRNLSSVLKKAGVVVLKDQYGEEVIASLKQLRQVQRKYNKQYRGYPSQLASSGRKALMSFKSKDRDAWVESELATGHTVTLRYHQANRQLLGVSAPTVAIPEPDPAPIPAKAEPKQIELWSDLWSADVRARYQKQARICALWGCLRNERQDKLLSALLLVATRRKGEIREQSESTGLAKRKILWIERNLQKSLNQFTDTPVVASVLPLLEPAQFVEYGTQLLLTAAPPVPEPERDDLVDFLLSIGGVITKTEDANYTVSELGSVGEGSNRGGLPERGRVSVGAGIQSRSGSAGGSARDYESVRGSPPTAGGIGAAA